jgi:hypothetical protein
MPSSWSTLAAIVRRRHALDFQAEGDVLFHRHPRKQRVFLEHHAALRTGAGHQLAVGGDGAGRRQRKAGDGIQQRRLAAAGRTEQADELALRDVEVDVLQCYDIAFGGLEDLVDVTDLDMGCGHVSSPGHGASAADDCSVYSCRRR